MSDTPQATPAKTAAPDGAAPAGPAAPVMIGIIVVALAIGVVIILYVTAPIMGSLIGSGVLWAAAAMTFVGLVAGHLLGGPDEGNRGALAVASAARHPGVAIAIAAGAFPTDKGEITGTVLLYLLANAVLTIPYMKWRARLAPA